MAESEAHANLKRQALIWLNQVGCYLFSCEVTLPNMGIADAVGVKRNGDIYVVEAKVSQADLVCQKQQNHTEALFHMDKLPADFFYLILADKLVPPEHYHQWGVVRHFRVVVRAPRQTRVDAEAKKRTAENVARSLCMKVYGRLIWPNAYKKQD